jgi:hypothetical protein
MHQLLLWSFSRHRSVFPASVFRYLDFATVVDGYGGWQASLLFSNPHYR